MSSKAAGALHEARQTCTIALTGLRARPRERRSWKHLVAAIRALAGWSLVPVVVVSLAVGALAALHVGAFAGEVTGESGTAARLVLAAVGWAAPPATALLLAGACGSVMAAEPTSRALPGEPAPDDAVPESEVPSSTLAGSTASGRTGAVDEVQHLVGARMWAAAVVGVLLVGVASAAGAAGGLVVEVVVHDVSAGTYLGAAGRLLEPVRATSSLATGFASGLVAAAVTSAAGLHATAGRRSVGDAVQRSVVVTLVLVVVTYLVATLLISVLVPEQLLLFRRPLVLWEA